MLRLILLTMNIFQKFDNWTDDRRAPVWGDTIRISLGIYLFYKGFIFTADFEGLTRSIDSMHLVFLTIPTAHYVSFALLISGILISFGAYTRIATAMNIPNLTGAVILDYQVFPTVEDHMELPIAITVLVLLIGLFIYGGGRYSLDEIRRRDIARKKNLASQG